MLATLVGGTCTDGYKDGYFFMDICAVSTLNPHYRGACQELLLVEQFGILLV